MNSVIVKAPSSTANLGPGFDVFGLALNAFFDTIKMTKTKQKGIRIKTLDGIPTSLQKNTAGIIVKKMAEKFKIKNGIDVFIKKGVPVGFGLGSSAASAAAATVAFDRLFNLKLDTTNLVKFAGMGEKASAGSIHYDNVAASVLGGFVIVRTNPFNVIKITPPSDLALCVAVPALKVPKQKTKVSRSVIPKNVKFINSVENLSNAAAIVAGFARKDSDMIGSSIKDVIVQPARMHMIPGFTKVRSGALKAGALGVTISGAGPSVIAFTKKSFDVRKIGAAMERGFGNVRCQIIHCRPSRGASR